MNKDSVRQSNIELLRIILIMMVIIVHFNLPSGNAIGIARDNHISINLNILYILESIGICAVNTFVLITGYFMCTSSRIRVSKVFSLMIQVSIYSLIAYLIEVAIGQTAFSAGRLVMNVLPNSWFVSIYIALYLLSPFINSILCKLSQKQYKILLLISFLLFSVNPTILSVIQDILGWTTSGLSPISISGSGEGYTIVNFVFMYLIGAYIRMYGIKLKFKPIFGYVSLVVIVFVGLKFLYGYSTMFYDYCNVFVVLEAVMLFLVFQQMQMPIVRTINTLSKYAFSVYLLHGYFYVLFDIEKIVTSNPIIMLGMIFVICVTLYSISWLIAFVYDHLSRVLSKIITVKDYFIEV